VEPFRAPRMLLWLRISPVGPIAIEYVKMRGGEVA
jgi:hypothetical protein